MLYLYQSNRLETLADILTALHQSAPLQGSLAAEEIIVQSQGMRRFLSIHLAQTTGIAANLNFQLPAGWTWRLMRQFIPNTPTLSPFAPEVMRWRLFGLFQSPEFQSSAFTQSRQALEGYLNSSDQAAYQLAGQLSDIFDQYLVYRATWINAWKAGKLLDLGAEEIWQAELWRFLDDDRQSAPHRVAQWRQLLSSINAHHLPERYFVFGIATLAPMYLQLLQEVSKHTDVHIFALNPSSEYWGNVIEPAQILNSPDDIDLSQSGHPLLASLGKQGRDFFDSLADANISHDGSYFESPTTDTLLHALQSDIQTLNLPQTVAADLLRDGSVCIASAHSPLRELHILKDTLLSILAEHPDWQPHDIAVLTPNIEPYSPFIDAVFGQNPHNQAIPYSLSDVKLSRRQPLLYALEKILELLQSRFEVDQLLTLLENEIVLHRFELTRDDLPLLHDTIAALNIHWGINETMRSEHGATNPLFTWQQGLDRLTLGWMLPETDHALWQNLSAWHGDPNQIDVFSRFRNLIDTLADIWHEWNQATNISTWAVRVRLAVQQLFAAADTDQATLQQLEQTLARWQEEAALAGFSGSLSLNTATQHITHFLDSQSQAAFLSGGITFCGMVPMRSLPFKVICLLGLNDGDFPRNTKATAFDLIAQHPQKNDRARRDDDRYLFLEAIISARDILYLSYIGRSIHNNDALAPSTLLNELIDTLATMTGESSQTLLEHWVTQHPLQAFSNQYFQSSSTALFSTRNDYADALNQPIVTRKPFFDGEPIAIASNTNHIISLLDFLRFWRNPVRHWLENQLDWKQPYTDEAWDAAEPFNPTATEAIHSSYLNARRQDQDFERVGVSLQAQSLLPEGILGDLWQQHFQVTAKALDTELCQSPKYPSVPFDLTFAEKTLSGSLNQLYQHGQIFFLNRKLNAPQRLSLMLEHLIYCAVAPNNLPLLSHLLLPDAPESWPTIDAKTAHNLLQPWLAYYQIGQTRPLPFFAKTSLQAAQEQLKTNDLNKALNKARSIYRGNKVSKGQCDYEEVALVFGSNESEPIDSPLFWNMVSDLLVPLMENLKATELEPENT